MTIPWRLPICVAALTLTVNAGVATAQTVIVRKARPESTIEIVLNADTVASGPADRAGDVTLDFNLSKSAGKTQADILVFVDACAQATRVVIVERGVTPPSPAGCDRREIPGLFLLRDVTSLVIDVSVTPPAMHLRQGRPPAEWLRDPVPGAPRVRRRAPAGLIVSGAGGLSGITGVAAVACGTVSQCSAETTGVGYGIATALWFTSVLGVEGSYVRPPRATASGSGDTFRFDSTLDAHVLNVAGKVGVPIGPVRLYGLAGPTYHRATLTTSETINDTTTGGVTTTGGTQTLELRTAGWSWTFGAGMEAWVTGSLGIYGEVGSAWLKGSARSGGEGEIDDRLTWLLVGARVRIGR